MGGAMDLVAGVKKIIVVMEHVAKEGSPKFIPACTLPPTGRNVVDMIITDLCVFSRPDHHSAFSLIELAPGWSVAEIAAKTTAAFSTNLSIEIDAGVAHPSFDFGFSRRDVTKQRCQIHVGPAGDISHGRVGAACSDNSARPQEHGRDFFHRLLASVRVDRWTSGPDMRIGALNR